MGEHGTWFDFLHRFSWWNSLHDKLASTLGAHHPFLIFEKHHFTLVPVLTAMVVIGFIIAGSLSFFRGTRGDAGLVPPRKMTFRHLFEVVAEGIYGVIEGAMGPEQTPKYFPLIAAVWFFILFANLIGLVPGFITPDDVLNTNLAIAGVVFIATHYYGVREHGLAYFKHFLGPVWWLAPFMLILELIQHIVRPVSLSLRLLGNMAADHKVLLAMFTLVPFFLPIPFYLLGMLVCVVQALVFCGLTTAYFAIAVAHEEH